MTTSLEVYAGLFAGDDVWIWWLACTSERPAPSCDAPGTICTWLGVAGQASFGPEGRPRRETTLYWPMDLTFDRAGTAYYADFNNHVIRRVRPDGTVRDVAGVGVAGDGRVDRTGCWDGCPASAFAWNGPADVELDPRDDDILWVAAWGNDRIVRVDLRARTASFSAGDADPQSFDDGPGQQASFDGPSSVALAPDGTLYVADSGNQLIRRITTDGVVGTLAGAARAPGYSGDGGPAGGARLHLASGEGMDPAGQLALADGRLLFADTRNGVIRAIDLTTGRITTVAGRSRAEDGGAAWGYAGDEGPARDAVFAGPHDLAVAADGTMYVADTGNDCVRRVSPDGIVHRFAGRCGEGGFAGDGGPATDALLSRPYGVSVGPDGAIYVVDTHNHVVRRVAP